MSLTTYREVCTDLLNGLDELQDPRYPFPGYTTAAMDRARELLAQPAPAAPARLRHCPTHGQQPPEAWGCPECVRELRDELAAARLQQVSAPAEGELIDLAGNVEAWAAQLHEGTPEERLLGRVAAVLRQRQKPPHQGEVDALIKILSRMARQLDFMPDGPPNGPVIHRVIELLRQLSPPAIISAAELLQQRAGELATLRQQVVPVPVSERLPDTSDPSECRMPSGDCWWFDPVAGGLSMDGAWYMDTYQICYTHWLPANAIPALSEYRPHA